MLQSRDQDANKPKKLRTACDICHQAKMKCSGGKPCNGCRDSGYECSYSVSNRIGRPKGTKNKRTLERMSRTQSDDNTPNKSRNTSGNSSKTNLDLGVQPGSLAFDSGMGLGSNPTESTSIDPVFSTNSSYSLQASNTFEPFPDGFNSWYDFGYLSGNSTVDVSRQSQLDIEYVSAADPNPQQQSSLSSSLDSGALMHKDSRHFSHDDSAYVSPLSLFNDRGSIDSGSDWSGFHGSRGSEGAEQSNVSTSTSSSLASSATCNCIQNHAELLCRLKDLEQRHSTPRLDVVLSSAQQALVLWKDVIECRVCQHDDNQEVLILSGMSIGTVLRALSKLCTEYYNGFVSSGEAIRRQQPAVETPDGMKSAIGFYEIKGEERMAVTDLLISRTLDKVKFTLVSFRERLEAMKTKKSAAASESSRKRSFPGLSDSDVDALSKGETGDLNHLLQVWQNLEGTVQILDGIMRKGNVPTCDRKPASGRRP